MTRDESSEATIARRPKGPLAAAACLLLVGISLISSSGPNPSSARGASRGVARPATASLAGPPRLSRPIERVCLGDRVVAGNPEATTGTAETEVEPATWRRVDLLLPAGPGSPVDVDIALLRPIEWVEDVGAVAGSTVDLELPELGVEGPAQVLAVGPCPPIASGPGRVVTGTFAHDSDSVLDLRIEGQAEPIGVTATHLVYSEDRRGFVAAGELRPGEALRPTAGMAKVLSLERRGGVERVYNLEVNVEHAYRVADSGVLVHNGCPKPKDNPWNDFQYRNKGAYKNSREAADAYNAAKKPPYILFNNSHSTSMPRPKGVGPNGGALQSHHGLQQEWAKANNLPRYRPGSAPTVTLETGAAIPGIRGALPHTIISNRQNARQAAREAAGNGAFSSTLDEELGYIVHDFSAAGFDKSTISRVLEQQYKMLDKLGANYARVPGY